MAGLRRHFLHTGSSVHSDWPAFLLGRTSHPLSLPLLRWGGSGDGGSDGRAAATGPSRGAGALGVRAKRSARHAEGESSSPVVRFCGRARAVHWSGTLDGCNDSSPVVHSPAFEITKVADGLVKVQVALGNIASKRERVKILYKKIEDLIKYLDPEYIDRIAIPDATKLQFILAEEQFILSQVALLEQVDNLVPMLDSAPIKAVPEHAARLQHLAQIHIQQQDKCVEITEESKALLEEYNKITMLLSKQFVQWDELLCQLEAAKQVKPAEE
uniref:dynactin subunit 3 isoform X1 n=1 Tax=Ictidomys tridecemlineatus TaxID=43179 RepID=UPI001A9EB9A2|nr:dynactin subunit 3 isoform X1 [Ictidomys tridecemlineatus]